MLKLCVYVSFITFLGNLALCGTISNSRTTKWRKIKAKKCYSRCIIKM